MMEDVNSDFFEDDEPIEAIREVLKQPPSGVTGAPASMFLSSTSESNGRFSTNRAASTVAPSVIRTAASPGR